jgi:hypothetical protein
MLVALGASAGAFLRWRTTPEQFTVSAVGS